MSRPRLINDLIAGLRRVLPGERGPYALHEPSLGEGEWQEVKACLESGWVSSAGPAIGEFEASLARVTGVPHAIATVNGTAALHLCLLAAGVKRKEEVLAPTLTFVATINAISYCGALPHFVDSTRESFGLDASKLAAHLRRIAIERDGEVINKDSGRRIAAVLCTHVFGHPADLGPLAAVCADFDLPLIEDAAEALGSTYRGVSVGGHGRLAALSFNGNKIITTGGGGAVLTRDPALAARLRHLATTAKEPHAWRYQHDEVGYNYRLPNLNAALGIAQLRRLEEFVTAKRVLAERYANALAEIDGIAFVREPDYARSNYWLNTIALDRIDAGLRDEVLQALHGEGIQARPLWTPMHRLPIYAKAPRDELSVAEELAQRLINLPSSAALAENRF